MKILITGGAGFIGSNLASRLLTEGYDVTIYDNLSRTGCNSNIAWLGELHGVDSFSLVEADLKDYDMLQSSVENMQIVYHLAGQVAVTTSVRDPRGDFNDNALGTFNVLEASRLAGDDPIFLYASTNKVYGGIEGVNIIENERQYCFGNLSRGVSEMQSLDFHSPYGCSKGAADQYVRDYYRIYGLRTVVMRQSCIYGYRQFGIEDQGWLAWFIINALKGRSITIYGDGKQVRDVLFIDDLLDAYEAVIQRIDVSAGQIYNIGGGPQNAISIWAEFGPMLENLLGQPISVKYLNWRPGDQRVYISDIRKAKNELNWQPDFSVEKGVKRLFDWIRDNQSLFENI